MNEAVAEAPRLRSRWRAPATARLLALLLPAALLAGAFGSQYFGGLYPCEMCWWQRYAHFAALVPAALAFTAPAAVAAITDPDAHSPRWPSPFRAQSASIMPASRLKIFEGFTTCTAMPAATTTAELLKQITAAPLVRCDQVQWSFLGISMAGWNAILSLGGAAVIAFLTLKGARR